MTPDQYPTPAHGQPMTRRRLREIERARAAEAERAGVLIALPMTLCYLPAFFLLGLAPMVISLGTSILSSH